LVAMEVAKRRRVLPEGADRAKASLDHLWCRAACAAVSSGHFPPRPAVEFSRRREVLQLRSHYEERVRRLCQTAEAPRESFNRWLLARLNSPSGHAAGADPLLGGSARRVSLHDGEEAARSPLGMQASAASVLHGELMTALPVNLPYIKSTDGEGQLVNLQRYASALLGLFEECSETEDIRAACTVAVQWAEDQKRNSKEPARQATEAAERLAELRRRSLPLVRNRFHDAVCDLCADLEHVADQAAAAIAQQHADARVDSSRLRVSAVFDARRQAYIFSLSDGTETCPGVEAGGEPEDTCTDGSGEDVSSPAAETAFVVSAGSFGRLSAALRRSARLAAKRAQQPNALGAPADRGAMASVAELLAAPDCVWDMVFCLLCRYDALFGPGRKEGGGFHAALPAPVFDAIAGATGGPHVECFASPMLCRGKPWRYCSLFGDLDVFFGSLGSFLGDVLAPESLGGSFEVNPPFLPAVVVQMVDKILASLERAEAAGVALQFVVILPGFSPKGRSARPEYAPSSVDRLFQSPHTRAITGRQRREFTFGLSFKTDRQWPQFAVHSRAVLLQTSAAAADCAGRAGEGGADRDGPPPLLACLNRAWGGAQESDGDPEAADVVCGRGA